MILNIAKQFQQINSKMDGDLLYRLYGSKGFTSVPADVWQPTNYLKLCQIKDASFPIETILKVMNLTESKNTGDFITSIGYQFLEILMRNGFSQRYTEFLLSIGVVDGATIDATTNALKQVVLDEQNFNHDAKRIGYGFR